MAKATFFRTESNFRVIKANGNSSEVTPSDMGVIFTELGIADGETMAKILKLATGQSVTVDNG